MQQAKLKACYWIQNDVFCPRKQVSLYQRSKEKQDQK